MKGLTQVDLARMAGIRRATLSSLELGKTKGIDFVTLERIAEVLEVDAAYLVVHEREGKRRSR